LASDKRRQQGYVAVGLVAAFGLVAGLGVAGAGASSTAVSLLSGQGWLANTSAGAVSHVNGYSGKVDASVPAGVRAGDPFIVVQRGDGAYVVDQRTGKISAIDGANQSAGPQVSPAVGGSRVRVVVGHHRTYLVDGAKGVVQRVDPKTLQPEGRKAALGGRISDAVVGRHGTLWAALPGKGRVVAVGPHRQRRTVSVGHRGDVVTLAAPRAGVVAVDLTAGRARHLDRSAPPVRFRPDRAARSADAAAAGHTVVAAADRHVTVLTGGSAHRLTLACTAAQVAARGRWAHVRCEDGGMQRIDLRRHGVRSEPGPAGGAQELTAAGGVPFANNPANSSAVAYVDGHSRQIDKYDAAQAKAKAKKRAPQAHRDRNRRRDDRHGEQPRPDPQRPQARRPGTDAAKAAAIAPSASPSAPPAPAGSPRTEPSSHGSPAHRPSVRPTRSTTATVPSVSIGDTRGNEGDTGTTPLHFAVQLSAPTSHDATVHFATQDRTARAGSDYRAAAGTVRIPAGTTHTSITVRVNGDTTVEHDETFAVLLTRPVRATLGHNPGIGTIINDDSAPNATVTRIAGHNRFDTAVAISRATFASAGQSGSHAGAVVLARGDESPDALVGVPLADRVRAPLLLTRTCALPAQTAAEIRRVLGGSGTVYLLGGTGAICPAVADELKGTGYTVHRIGGHSRYDTALQVAAALGNPGTVFLAAGQSFPDDLGAASAAARVGGVVLFVKNGQLPPKVTDYLRQHPGHVYAVGGPAASADPDATKLVGSNRYDTATKVARYFFPHPSYAGIATGERFPDALTAAGARAAVLDGPVLLVQQHALPAPTRSYLTAHHGRVKLVEVYGGQAAVGDDVLNAVRALF
jgi:putative cell wall-binding protein